MFQKTCHFTERPRDPYLERIDALSDEVSSLRRNLDIFSNSGREHDPNDTNTRPPAPAPGILSASIAGPVDDAASRHSNANQSAHHATQSPEVVTLLRRTRRSHFTTEPGRLPDFVSVGLITLDQATLYFATFFAGCDHYVPVFDATHDTLPSIRQRSSLLFAALCTVGCRVVCGTDAHQWRLLNFHLKRMLGSVLSAPDPTPSLETIQALLVRACYSAERSLLTATATRLAIEAGLPQAYDEVMARQVGQAEDLDTSMLIRQARTWLHVLVLSHILHVDAGDMLTCTFVGDPRRARVLLENPHTTVLDRFLFAQVELNVLRATIFASLSERVYQDEEDILSLVRDATIDIDLWHSDWARILQPMPDVPPWILVNLRVQKCWATTMALCRAVRTAGVDNVDFMSPAQRSVLSLAKDSLRAHLQTIIAEPRLYLHNLKYAMDFVWAKCAFCYLLLLKLCVLLPEEHGTVHDDLVACGAILARELRDAGIANSTANMYLQLLQTGTDKFSRALQGQYEQPDDERDVGGDGSRTAGSELDSFVPDQFVFEWDFPGLTLFSSSTTGIGWLDDILLGALNGGGDFYGFMAPTAEFGDTSGG
ncbi:C6 zinc finger domain protein [Cordyceps militaris CM01]|uniref:C6 zinc finger domain protein n=1 Tax=Cordyceps militaris (strain CM01) TaxID=983644 RepID=G3JFH7_CORMM|nr:C6 zinc finger domain protein [Cordyceps militaris CM01]EGX93551.1 C6 zinc finger domain protein [Cordyceps militaris CM01]